MKTYSNDTPFFGKTMVSPDDYIIFKFGGDTTRDTQKEISTMLKFFSDISEEQLRYNIDHYNLQNMFELVKRYFWQELSYDCSQITLSNRYQNTFNSYIYNDKDKPAFIHIDELFESTVMSFLLAMFKWSKDFNQLDIYGACFTYVLFLLNDVCIFGEMQSENANLMFLNTVKDDLQILQLAENCYWTIVVFTLAHEVAHSYLSFMGKEYKEKQREKEEYDADGIAYHILLKILMQEDSVLEKYTYLAPMIYMDFFDLYYYTDRVLYKSYNNDLEHPLPFKRKNRLFALVNKDEYVFDTSEGNDLYSGFLDVYDEYKDQLLLKMERGKLDSILRTERRMRLRELKEDE